jgi:carbon-monoxide dehydrogenase medium subunit
VTLPSFDIDTPASCVEASEILSAHPEDAAAYHGGTELVLLLKLRLASFSRLVDLKGIAALKRLELAGSSLVIGAGVTHRELELSALVRDVLPSLTAMERTVANVRVRAAGTLGGNLCFSDPHSDPATFFQAVGCDVVVAGTGGTRSLSLSDFMLGAYRTALAPGEILQEIHVPLPAAGTSIVHRKLAFHERPTITVTCVVRAGDPGALRVAIGSVGPRPQRSAEAEGLLSALDVGDPDAVRLAAAGRAAAGEIRVTADENGSAEFKQQLVSTLVQRSFRDACRQAVADAA